MKIIINRKVVGNEIPIIKLLDAFTAKQQQVSIKFKSLHGNIIGEYKGDVNKVLAITVDTLMHKICDKDFVTFLESIKTTDGQKPSVNDVSNTLSLIANYFAGRSLLIEPSVVKINNEYYFNSKSSHPKKQKT